MIGPRILNLFQQEKQGQNANGVVYVRLKNMQNSQLCDSEQAVMGCPVSICTLMEHRVAGRCTIGGLSRSAPPMHTSFIQQHRSLTEYGAHPAGASRYHQPHWLIPHTASSNSRHDRDHPSSRPWPARGSRRPWSDCPVF